MRSSNEFRRIMNNDAYTYLKYFTKNKFYTNYFHKIC